MSMYICKNCEVMKDSDFDCPELAKDEVSLVCEDCVEDDPMSVA